MARTSAWLPVAILALLLYHVVASSVPGSQECCWGQETIAPGHTALALPHCCTAFTCHNGLLEKLHIGGPRAVDCCEFAGEVYPNGARLEDHCIPLVCSLGNWSITNVIDDCCAHCSVYDDPHFTTWDDHHYDFHGSCNYSLAQTDSSQEPLTAVYSHFRPCFSHASCLHLTTFRENPHTIITLGLTGPNEVDINGETFNVPSEGVHTIMSSAGPHPVLAWRDNLCLYLLGSSQIMVLQCSHQIEVWAHPTHANFLDGLCGHFNFEQDDDLTSRSGSVTPLTTWPLAFPESWRTADQNDPTCMRECVYCPAETADPCRAGGFERQRLLDTCRHVLHPVIGRDGHQLSHFVGSCVFDLCMLDQTGATAEEKRKWIIVIIIIVYKAKLTIAKIEDKWVPTSPPTHGVCSLGARWMKECNWCSCSDDGTNAACTRIGCPPEFAPELGEPVCEDGSWWRPDDCNWCLCVRGGAYCSHEDCDLPTLPPHCLLEVQPGHCHTHVIRYYYNSHSDACDAFYYSGCGGNHNNFNSLEECRQTCKPTPSPSSVCLKKIDAGPCYKFRYRFAFNSTSRQCQMFLYGGCEGNLNRFLSYEKCTEACGATSTICPELSCQPECVSQPDPSLCPVCKPSCPDPPECPLCPPTCISNPVFGNSCPSCVCSCSSPLPLDCPLDCPATTIVVTNPVTGCEECVCPMTTSTPPPWCPFGPTTCPSNCTTYTIIVTRSDTGCPMCICEPPTTNTTTTTDVTTTSITTPVTCPTASCTGCLNDPAEILDQTSCTMCWCCPVGGGGPPCIPDCGSFRLEEDPGNGCKYCLCN